MTEKSHSFLYVKMWLFFWNNGMISSIYLFPPPTYKTKGFLIVDISRLLFFGFIQNIFFVSN